MHIRHEGLYHCVTGTGCQPATAAPWRRLLGFPTTTNFKGWLYTCRPMKFLFDRRPELRVRHVVVAACIHLRRAKLCAQSRYPCASGRHTGCRTAVFAKPWRPAAVVLECRHHGGWSDGRYRASLTGGRGYQTGHTSSHRTRRTACTSRYPTSYRIRARTFTPCMRVACLQRVEAGLQCTPTCVLLGMHCRAFQCIA